MARGKDYARIVQMRDGSIGYESSYDPGLVAALKSQIPYPDRRWDPAEKLWRIASKHVQTLQTLSTQYLGVEAEVQANLFAAPSQKLTKLVKLLYLGMAKDRGGDEPSSMGFADSDWSLIFSLSVLRGWFEFDDQTKPTETLTLYSVLGAKRGASGAEIKSAYRKAARTWHPDLNPEPDAKEQFMRVQNAYEIVSNPLSRRRYDAGLAFAATVDRPQTVVNSGLWRPPLRCGYLLLEGESVLGQLNVSKILKWDDITDSQGRVMVTYWTYGADMFEKRWV